MHKVNKREALTGSETLQMSSGTSTHGNKC